MFFILPAVNQMSLIVMADIVVVPFFLGSWLLFLAGTPDDRRPILRHLFAGAFLMGWGLGVRPQWLLLFVMLACAMALRIRSIPHLAATAAAGIAGTLAWLWPTALNTGGFLKYLDLTSRQFSAHPGVRSKFSPGEFAQYAELWLNEWTFPATLVGIAATGGMLVSFRQTDREGKAAFLKRWSFVLFLALGGAIITLAYHPLTFQRGLLPALPATAIFLAAPVSLAIRTRRGVLVPAAIVLIFAAGAGIGLRGAFLRAAAIHQSIPPPVASAHWIRDHYGAGEAFLLPEDAFRHWSYYLDAFSIPVRKAHSSWHPVLNPQNRPYLITDQVLPGEIPISVHRFRRSPDIYYKHNRSRVVVFALDALDVYFDEGFHTPEPWGFWITDDCRGWIRASRDNERTLNLTIRSAFQEARVLQVFVDDSLVWSGTVRDQNRDLRIEMPLTRNWARLRFFTPDGSKSPKEVSGANDTRKLSFAISGIRLGLFRFQPGVTVPVNLTQQDLSFLGNGWSSPETWGTWTEGNRAGLRIRSEVPLRAGIRIVMNARGHIEANHPGVDLSFSVNGCHAGDYPIRKQGFHDFAIDVPEAALQRNNRELALEITIDNPASPLELGLSEDSRKLGLGLRSIRVAPPESPDP